MFRFTIRELVLLTLVVAMGAAWWADRSTLAHRLKGTYWSSRYDALADALRVEGYKITDESTTMIVEQREGNRFVYGVIPDWPYPVAP